MRGYEFLQYQLTGIPYEIFMEKWSEKEYNEILTAAALYFQNDWYKEVIS